MYSVSRLWTFSVPFIYIYIYTSEKPKEESRCFPRAPLKPPVLHPGTNGLCCWMDRQLLSKHTDISRTELVLLIISPCFCSSAKWNVDQTGRLRSKKKSERTMWVQTGPPRVVSGSGGKQNLFGVSLALPEAGDRLKILTQNLKAQMSVAQLLWSGLKVLICTVDRQWR